MTGTLKVRLSLSVFRTIFSETATATASVYVLGVTIEAQNHPTCVWTDFADSRSQKRAN
jgi:hypothetical protein